jgi:uracil-DNA glycosylase family 4
MFSIKSSFANCAACPLLESNSCILETNCKDDLSKVDIVFVAENPGEKEVKGELPLIGRAGEMFRKYFKSFGLNKLKYLLTNVVLCQTLNPDGTTGNPTDETIDICKENCFKIIEYCKPKLIVLMGGTPMKAFGIAKSGITNLRGFHKWNNYNVYLTVHPSFVNRNRSFEPKFEQDMKDISTYMGSSTQGIIRNKIGTVLQKNEVFRYKIPDKFYSDLYRLVDIQYLEKEKKILYIFRDNENNKIFHKENDDYYCYQIPKDSKTEMRYLVKYEDLVQVKIPYKQKTLLDPVVTYEGDLKLPVKHSQDYYFYSKGEPTKYDLNIMFFDIETYSEERGFPLVDKAEHMVCMITYSFHGKFVTLVVDNKEVLKRKDVEEIKDNPLSEVIICKNERELLTTFARDLKKLKIDILAGWNIVNFDIPYNYNRCIKIGINPNMFSELGEVYVDTSRNYAEINGIVILDQYVLYRNFVQGSRENYKLDTIGEIELGMKKLGVGSSFSDMFRENINDAIKYNIRDVQIVEKLEEKLQHISLQDEVKKISNSSFRGSSSSMGMLDSLMVSFMKNKGFASKDADMHREKVEFPGAYVKEPIVGLHDYIVDFDFTSLYPSIIITYNIGINTFIMKFKDYELGYDFVYDFDSFPDKVTMVMDPLYSSKEQEFTKEELIEKVKKEDLVYTITGCFFRNHKEETSYYSEILSSLLTSRKEYKDKMFEAKQKNETDLQSMYDTRQQVYKIFSNALYGVLGNKIFRYFSVDMSRSITLSGQQAIKSAILEANSYIYNLIHNKVKEEKILTKSEMYGKMDRETEYVITGDTDSLFAKLDKLIISEKSEDKMIKIEKYCNTIQDHLNNYIKDLVKQHNVNERSNRLSLKNELVIKRGLYISKKHYANKIISQEGREVNEIRSMGLETKRSDFSVDTKSSLEELLDLLLNSELLSLPKIYQFIERKKKEFITKIKRGEKSIAKPAAFTKELKSYKTVPQSVRGCLAWNNLVYKAFVVGDRGYLFKINGIDIDKAPKDVVERYRKEYLDNGKKLDVICVPNEEIKLPDYFIIDAKAMYEFAWEKRYEQLLEHVFDVNERILTI